MKLNLGQQLGSRYIREMYVGALFRVEDDIHKVRDVSDTTVVTDKLALFESGGREWERHHLSADVLQDFTSFQYPTLGYRQGVAGKFGNVVAYISARRTALRGLRIDQLSIFTPPIYNMLYPDDLYHNIPPNARIRALFAPEFTPFIKGVGQLIAGDTAGFAVSNNVAVAMSCSGNAERLGDVLFRGKIVGHVTTAGEVQIVNKIMHRDSMKSLLTT